MKKQFLIIALALAATSLAAQDWHYEYNDAEQTATVVSWDRWHDTDHGEAYGHDNCYEGDLVIPDKAPNGYAVTAIGPECFLECRNLTSIQFPSTLKRIGAGAFMSCTALPEHLSFPASLEYIGSGAYSGCISVRTLTIDDSDQTLTVAGSGMVYGAEFYNLESLETIYVGRNIVCEEPTLSLFGWQDHVKDITFGDKVTELPQEVCINATGLLTVKLSPAITVIPDWAFSGCEALESIDYGDITSIGEQSFSGCYNLKTINMFPPTLKSIGDGAFDGCNSLTSTVVITASVDHIGNQAFVGCSSVKQLNIEDCVRPLTVGVSGWNYTMVFTGFDQVEQVYIGRNLVCDDDPKATLFAGFEHPFELTFGDKVTELPQEVCINATGLLTVKLSPAITVIPDWAFSGCEALESIDYGDITSIGEQSFSGCYNLKTINMFPPTLKSIGDGAFDGCNSLTSTVVITASVDHIGNQAFVGCSSVKQLNIEDCVRPLTVGVSGWNYTMVFTGFDQVEQVYIGRNLVCDDDPKATLFAGFEHPFELTFGDLVTELPKEACAYSAGLKKLTIGDGIKLIPEMAFCSCTGLETFSLGRSVEAIGTSAFDGCFGLQQWYYHNSLKSIGSSAFYGYPMPYLNLGPSIEYIGNGAFAQSAIQEITCQGTVAPVCEGWVFDGMSPLATLYIPKGAKPAYENAECWKEFFAEEKVVEFTPTAIDAVEYNGNKLSHLTSHPSSSLWYTIDGRQLSGEPSSAGIYLHDGRAVVKK